MLVALSSYIITPLQFLFASFQYFSLVEKTDSTGLLKQIGELGVEPDDSDDDSYL
jgi:hypothetical protein